MPLAERELYTGNVLYKGVYSVQNGLVVVPSVSDGRFGMPLAERELYTGNVLYKGVYNVQNVLVVEPSVSDGRFGMPLAERELYNAKGCLPQLREGYKCPKWFGCSAVRAGWNWTNIQEVV